MQKDEINEILEHLSATQKINNGWTSFSVEECKGLYDYITYLQEECRSNGNIIHNLQEENERLKKLKERYQLEKEDYKTRNEKAIEYIENNKQLSMFADLRKEGTHQYDLECDADDLLEILQGKSDE